MRGTTDGRRRLKRLSNDHHRDHTFDDLIPIPKPSFAVIDSARKPWPWRLLAGANATLFTYTQSVRTLHTNPGTHIHALPPILYIYVAHMAHVIQYPSGECGFVLMSSEIMEMHYYYRCLRMHSNTQYSMESNGQRIERSINWLFCILTYEFVCIWEGICLR